MAKMTFGAQPDPGRKGPAFEASYGGSCSNDGCLDGQFEEGDEIRADGAGGWECAYHLTEEQE